MFAQDYETLNITMNLMPTFEFRLVNTWLLCIPMFAQMIYFIGIKKDIARRMSDMTGYNTKEKFFTIMSSVAPYPFMIATFWTPFTPILPLLFIGLLIYVFGMVLIFLTIKVITETPEDKPFLSGPYRISRNPFYVAETAIFSGICLVSANIILFVYLVSSVLVQHLMILAEERMCKQKYHPSYQRYMEEVPRYLVRF